MSPRSKIENEVLRSTSIEKIVNAAIELFSAQGYERTSISQIASKAGISKGLIYNYFESKQALLRGVFDFFSSQEEEIMANVVDENPRKFLKNLFRWTFKEIRNRPDFWKMIMGLSLQPDMFDFIHEMAVTKMKTFHPLLENLLEASGVSNAHQEARLVAAQLDGIVIHYLLVKDDYPLDEIENYLIEKYCYEK
jgi:AcrR family transcriptional regulator